LATNQAVIDDWEYCREALQRHSRTFAIPISLLPSALERSVTCAYLLCRIADTIEDTGDWETQTKEALYRGFLDLLDGTRATAGFVRLVDDSPGGDTEELELLRNIGRVLNIFGQQSPELQRSCRTWIAELTRGMNLYSHRQPGPDGVTCLHSVDDLERYCYFVAGTIGQLLTDVFVAELSSEHAFAERELRRNAEQFGAGLQLVNILRDITTDLQRRWCFVPRTLLCDEGLLPDDLVDAAKADRARRALSGLFTLATSYLQSAFDYVLALPASQPQLRTFALIPLWLAVKTLKRCQGDRSLLVPGKRVKLGREEVVDLIRQCTSIADDDAALRVAFQRLSLPEPQPQSAARP
jgi:farnesyl-diphosphate farnesyltransferase